MSDTQASTYDEVSYGGNCFFYTHPDVLATVATLFGMSPPAVERCRVLELGCADGSNLIPMAMGLPGAHFVGIDLSPRQVEEGCATIQALGLHNIALEPLSLMDVGEDFGRFDYVICHGVYSWVPEAVQDRILEICARNLAPDGVAYVSYNTYPGWHARGLARDLMGFHVRRIAAAKARATEARAILEDLVRVLPDPESAYGRILSRESGALRAVSDSYVFHEHLEEENHPVYFHEFAERASRKGLRYLGEARSLGLFDGISPEAKGAIEGWSDDPMDREQYLDFLCNRTFRRSLLCHADASRTAAPSAELVRTMHISTLARPVSEAPDVHSTVAKEEFRSADGIARLSTNHPLIKAALVVLFRSHPRALSFEALWDEARSLLQQGIAPPPTDARHDRDRLAALMLQFFGSNLVELHLNPPRIAAEPGERPHASPLARLQAESDARITNLCLRHVELSDFDRLVIRLLDGNHDREAIVEALQEAIANETFTIQRGDEPVRDPEQVRIMLGEGVESSLERMARLALLLPQAVESAT